MKRKVARSIEHGHEVRALAPAVSTRALALRAVLLAAVAASAGCDPVREINRAGVWLGVIDAPRMAGEMAPVRAYPGGAIAVPSTHASGSASSAHSAVTK